MALGSWDPAAETASQSISLTPDLLAELAGYSAKGQLDNLSDQLSGDRAHTLSGLMKLPAVEWQSAVESTASEDIRHLIRFLAVAESLPGWEAGEHSPVIPLAKILRQRGEKLDRDFLLWLRDVSDNRFLPYGPL